MCQCSCCRSRFLRFPFGEHHLDGPLRSPFQYTYIILHKNKWSSIPNDRNQIAILNASGMNDRVQQQTLHVDKNMPFLALDQFACIKPVRINAGPPFSALFTLWLSMMQAVGLASRSAFSRHSTYSA